MNKNGKRTIIIYFFIFLIMFVIIGIYAGKTLAKEEGDLLLIISILLCYPLYLLSIFLHELGHMVFGLLTGYSFSSFRVFNIMILNDNGKLVFKKMSISGTAGQCIMFPKDNNTSFVLYNLGGVIFNIIFFIIAIGLTFIIKNNFIKVLLFDFGIMNLYDIVTNGIPAKSFINNDMCNIVELKNDKSSRDTFYNALHIQNEIVLGKRLKDISEKYIYKPREIKNSGDVDEMVFFCNQLIDKHEFEKVIKEIEGFINYEELNSVYRSMLINDLIYCYAVLNKEIDKATSYKDEEVKMILNQMKKYPAVIRTNYAYALLIDGNVDEANKYLDSFNKIKKTYPYKTDIESESELIEIAKNIHNKKDH